jgi:ParB family chromosome partitioning protein
MTHLEIEIKNLDHSPLNVRKTTSPGALEELKASITAHGLMQNLVVVAAKKGKYHVIAGSRRLEALRALQKEGKLPEGTTVPCQLADAAQAKEMSLAENVVRLSMHPADEFETWAALIDAGNTAAQIAQRFGVEEKLVHKRLKLGRVAPHLLKEFREEKLTLDALMAFTVSDDHKRQVKIYKGLQSWQKDDPSAIRSILTEQMAAADDKLALFVGIDAYRSAGGTTRCDLFSDCVYLENPELLSALVTEKLTLARKLLEEEGWGWIEVAPDYDYSFTNGFTRIWPQPTDVPQVLLAELESAEAQQRSVAEMIDNAEEEAELDALAQQEAEIEEKIDAINEQIGGYSAFDPEQMKLAGCYATVAHDGSLRIDKGLVRKDDRKKRVVAEGTVAATMGKPVYSRPLFDDLQAIRTCAARVEIARRPDIAFDLLLALRCALNSSSPSPKRQTLPRWKPSGKESGKCCLWHGSKKSAKPISSVLSRSFRVMRSIASSPTAPQ